ncbi:MAG TPA: aminotransferase class I/II-fold pyridoxal phosphate-dependent enzyme [Trichocoleus sp.]|jgi:arginine/lysine/ornithine decarboxylase
MMSFADRQANTPLLNTLQTAATQMRAAFHTPGHKRGQGTPDLLKDWLGAAVFQADLPELPELDNLFNPEGVIQAAQILAAEAFGAEQSWFLANGSTCGIEAAVLAVCNPGDKIVLPRNVHQSAISALILSGAIPVFVEPADDPKWGIAHTVTPAAVEAALAQHPDSKAVMLVSPTYYGVCADVRTIAQITHSHHIPLLIDEAHGAHFAFHPGLPPAALASGADLVVQSTHKVLSALTQAAMLHVQGDRLNRDRLQRTLQLVQSTSPSYLLLASLDAARHQMVTEGKSLLSQTLELAQLARTRISQIPGLRVFSIDRPAPPGCFALDQTRITIDVSGLGITGFTADEILHQKLNVTVELPGLHHLTLILTIGNTLADIDRLIQACQILARDFHAPATPRPPFPPSLPLPAAPLSPRDAFFSPTLTRPAPQAIGHLSAELICPYPPGIPVLFPGEVITAEAIEVLQQVQSAGGVITGCTDPTLQTLKVLAL